MLLKINKETNQIVEYCIKGNILSDENCDIIQFDIPIVQLNDDLIFSRFENGNIVYDENLKQLALNQEEINNLRAMRAVECFPYVNRGYLWYNELTAEQKQEFQTWYYNWLDVTETKQIPEKPEWLI